VNQVDFLDQAAAVAKDKSSDMNPETRALLGAMVKTMREVIPDVPQETVGMVMIAFASVAAGLLPVEEGGAGYYPGNLKARSILNIAAAIGGYEYTGEEF
jgi:hypothetical protein